MMEGSTSTILTAGPAGDTPVEMFRDEADNSIPPVASVLPIPLLGGTPKELRLVLAKAKSVPLRATEVLGGEEV
jgi:hypothetical protein